jgi:hypothetical protein
MTSGSAIFDSRLTPAEKVQTETYRQSSTQE